MTNNGDLEKLLIYLRDLSSQPENGWFKSKLEEEYGKGSSQVSEYVTDIKRTRYFLKNIDREFQKEGFVFYKNLSDRNLLKKFVNDYKEMRIANATNDILEYGRRMSIQLERGFDYIINVVNAWEEIEAEPEKYATCTIRGQTYPITVAARFFKKHSLSNEKIRAEISEIEFRAKACFCSIYYGYEWGTNWLNFSNVYFLRNKASHGSLSSQDLEKLNKLIAKFPEANGYYHKMFSDVMLMLKDLYKVQNDANRLHS